MKQKYRLRSLSARLVALAVLLTGVTPQASAETPAADVRAALGQVANALSANDPASAIQPFSKSFADRGKLRDYFLGLTNAFSMVNEVDVLDEQHSERETTATVRWTITLSSTESNHNEQRAAEIHLRFVPEKSKWKIVEFSPIAIFDPAEPVVPARRSEPLAQPRVGGRRN